VAVEASSPILGNPVHGRVHLDPRRQSGEMLILFDGLDASNGQGRGGAAF